MAGFEFEDAGLVWTEARLYPKFPHVYRGVDDLVVTFEADPEAVQRFLPRGVTADGDPTPCQAKVRWTPFSVHGPYHEAYVSATVRFQGERYRFLLLAYTDNDSPLVAGRELWGTPKKLATITRNWGKVDGPFTELLVGTLERPRGLPLMTAAMTIDMAIDPPQTAPLPTLLLRVLPNVAGTAPELAQLIRIDGSAVFNRSADGRAMLFTGRGSLSFGSASAVDPLHILGPRRITGASFARIDFEHGPGVVIHDYIA